MTDAAGIAQVTGVESDPSEAGTVVASPRTFAAGDTTAAGFG
jgi:hypothetical protein